VMLNGFSRKSGQVELEVVLGVVVFIVDILIGFYR
jgi:hypothetical protein